MQGKFFIRYFGFLQGQDINGVVNTTVQNADGLYGTTDIYRYAVLNGLHVALPSWGQLGSMSAGFQSGTIVGSDSPGQGSNAVNASYNDLLAVWDAFNGTGTGTQTDGNPPGWANNYLYLAATPSAEGHSYLGFTAGATGTGNDQNNMLVGLQVLFNDTGAPVI